MYIKASPTLHLENFVLLFSDTWVNYFVQDFQKQINSNLSILVKQEMSLSKENNDFLHKLREKCLYLLNSHFFLNQISSKPDVSLVLKDKHTLILIVDFKSYPVDIVSTLLLNNTNIGFH